MDIKIHINKNKKNLNQSTRKKINMYKRVDEKINLKLQHREQMINNQFIAIFK
jgi:hypothetical protein